MTIRQRRGRHARGYTLRSFLRRRDGRHVAEMYCCAACNRASRAFAPPF